ncbi:MULTISPECIES: uroporphyrinogen-III C-methyltransferase [unclassified Pseudomonas]|uniref:uroporphyrinogen-III C-methyltransferase n=1 Tax=unclassified Pseudomonas TaxID=196821 RepID=UPI0024491CDC|nr:MULTISPECIES: uroporphyrinogen-III C-methyltransferase [unclassified Pseudomonas]MDG9922459.1 uroporphyrinogen-III C-methyltransferase [Pseudomonas sp. GD04045]MDH0034343.1 uroporphyrinogen-III C-methyltransferase [Pseudomonas sp. GD04019]
MSETAPQISEQTPQTQVDQPPLAVTPKAKGRGPAWLALLVGLAALGAGGWSAWQLYQQQGQAAQRLAQFQQAGEAAQARVKASEEHVAKRLAGLPTADELATQRDLLVSLQGEQQRLAQSLSGLLGKSREDWRLAEAEHLLRLAMLRLSALQDVDSAVALVQGADDILRAQNDPQAFAARGELIKVLEALRSLPQVDRSGLFLQLAALRGQVAQLQMLAPEYILPAEVQSSVNASDSSRWEALWEELSRYVRIDLHADQDVRPQLAGQSLAQVRLTLALALEQAQWGALNGEQQVYRQALASASEVLDSYFDRDNQAVQAMQKRIGELSGQKVVASMPKLDDALAGLQAYLKRREAAELMPEAEAEPALEPDVEAIEEGGQ